jgi:hypothetical protein
MKTYTSLAIVLLCIPSAFLMAQNKPENLGTAINTEYSELGPLCLQMVKHFFGRKNHPQNKYGVNGSEQIAGSQDIWFSENTMGAWTPARRMSENLNRDQYNSILSISPDGQTILMKGAYLNGQYETRGFSIAKKLEGGWGLPRKLEIPKYEKLSEVKTNMASYLPMERFY